MVLLGIRMCDYCHLRGNSRILWMKFVFQNKFQEGLSRVFIRKRGESLRFHKIRLFPL